MKMFIHDQHQYPALNYRCHGFSSKLKIGHSQFVLVPCRHSPVVMFKDDWNCRTLKKPATCWLLPKSLNTKSDGDLKIQSWKWRCDTPTHNVELTDPKPCHQCTTTWHKLAQHFLALPCLSLCWYVSYIDGIWLTRHCSVKLFGNTAASAFSSAPMKTVAV